MGRKGQGALAVRVAARLLWTALHHALVVCFVAACCSLLPWAWSGAAGALAAAAVLLALLLAGDRLVLLSLGARRLPPESPVTQRVQNLCCRGSLPAVAVYGSAGAGGDVLAMETVLGRPTLLVGTEAARSLGDGELEAVLALALRRIADWDALFDSAFLFAAALLASPLLLAGRGRAGRALVLVLGSLLRPLLALHGGASRRMGGRGADGIDGGSLASAWRRLRHSGCAGSSWAGRLLTGIVSVRPERGDFLVESVIRG